MIQPDEILTFLQCYEAAARNYGINDLMNSPISDHEVEVAFGTGSCAPGPDKILSTRIDKPDRTLMKRCLLFLWNQVWSYGYFLRSGSVRIELSYQSLEKTTTMIVEHIPQFLLFLSSASDLKELYHKGLLPFLLISTLIRFSLHALGTGVSRRHC